MLDEMQNLLTLQELDIKVAKIEQQLAEVPKKAEETRQFYHAEEEACAQAKKGSQECELAIRKEEKEIATLKDQKKNLLDKSSMIRNNDEYRAAMLQIEMCDHAVSEKETKALEMMDELERLRGIEAEKQQALAEAKERAQAVMDELQIRQRNCQEALVELAGRREPLVAAVEPGLYRRYDRLRSSKNRDKTRPCVVEILQEEGEGGNVITCGCCHMRLPAQCLSDARKGKAVNCSSCSAILYVE